MSCEQLLEHLDELLAGQLPDEIQTELTQHLKACPACQEVLSGTKELLLAVEQLPDEIEPEHDLWPAISETIAEHCVVTQHPARQASQLHWSHIVGVAAALIIGVTLTLVYSLAPSPAPRTASTGDETRGASVAATAGGLDFTDIRQGLLAAVQQRSDSLSPQTMAIIMDSLATIDKAISTLNAEMKKNPDSARLLKLLIDAQQQEIKLLQHATKLPSEV